MKQEIFSDKTSDELQRIEKTWLQAIVRHTIWNEAKPKCTIFSGKIRVRDIFVLKNLFAKFENYVTSVSVRGDEITVLEAFQIIKHLTITNRTLTLLWKHWKQNFWFFF